MSTKGVNEIAGRETVKPLARTCASEVLVVRGAIHWHFEAVQHEALIRRPDLQWLR